MTNAASARGIKAANKRLRIERLALLKDWNDVLSSPAGRRVIQTILASGKIHDEGRMDLFDAGRRSLALEVWNAARECNLTLVATMEREAQGRELEEALQDELIETQAEETP